MNATTMRDECGEEGSATARPVPRGLLYSPLVHCAYLHAYHQIVCVVSSAVYNA